ncbi:DUF1501 domain-containing protein [Flagellimonas sp. HMM57]|uniref:DUF1501 domain-containing protein n=1 Tax=unclassified Flagellimonas TaxID=2644544 RepID=UPI0013D75298|nr:MULTISPECIES: DUF1501 domain-containing protein [unclassified Flagellimonas]UII76619.1 DUF1501 domain-containing protein [Flagellimonas sp. HMM57]
MKRRTFIKRSGLASGVLFVPNFLKAHNELWPANLGNKKLVIIQLSGGNDGLNTIVPYTNDVYYKNRVSIAQKKQDLLLVNDEVGFHSALSNFKNLFDDGYVTIMNNVGYPNPVRSHFRSTDIWQTASASNEILKTGWVGRYLDGVAKDPVGAIEVDDMLSTMMKGERINGIATKNARLLYNTTKEPYFTKVLENSRDKHLSEHNLGYLYKTAIDAKSSAAYIFEKTKVYKSAKEYPKNAFGKQLKTVSEFINSGLKTQIYYTSLGGFDTHANQVNAQKRLLGTYSNAIATFVNDLKNAGTFKDTIIFTFSEFGRRVKQNAANGTDHGAANAVFLMGENLKNPGMYNAPSSLLDLDGNGDIKYEIDFRQIYTSLLKQWLQTDTEAIISGKFEALDLV